MQDGPDNKGGGSWVRISAAAVAAAANHFTDTLRHLLVNKEEGKRYQTYNTLRSYSNIVS